MPSNLELKARIPSLHVASRQARALGARRKGIVIQKDTYFRVPRGRLKLREINKERYELIYYHRKNVKGNRFSVYKIIKVQQPDDVKSVLADMLGVRCVVRKTRELYLFRNARIHLDRVKQAGSFLEFEVLVTNGKRQAGELMKVLWSAFGIRRDAVVAGSYSDFLQPIRRRKKTSRSA